MAALSKKNPLDAAMFMIKEIGVAPVPGDGFYQEGKFGDECVSACTFVEAISQSFVSVLPGIQSITIFVVRQNG